MARNPHNPNKRRPPAEPEPVEEPRSTFGRGAVAAVVVIGLVAYLILFFATPVAELPGESPFGAVWRRYHLPLGLVLWPEALFEAWFGHPPRFAIVERIGVLLPAVAIVVVAVSGGRLALRACRADRGLTRRETIVFSTALGLSLVSLYTLFVGLAGLLAWRALFFVPGIGIVVAAVWWMIRRRGAFDDRDESSRSRTTATTGGDRWILWLAAPFVAVIVLGAMLPPVDFDVREYHLQVPKEFYQNGRIEFLPHNVYGNMALGSEMLSLAAMVVCGDWWYGALVGKTAAALCVPLTALALMAAGERFFTRSAGLIAAALYVSIPWVVRVSTSGLVEGVAAYFWFLAAYAMLLWRGPAEASNEAGHRDAAHASPRALLTGFLAGSAVAIKYPAALFVLLPAIGWAVAATVTDRMRHANRSPSGLRPLAAMLLAATVACGPWFAKNWVLAGNPTYPLLYSVFGGKTWNAEKDARWNAAHRPSDFRWQSLAGSFADVVWRSPWLSPLVVPLAALAVLVRRHGRLVAWLLGYFGYVIAAWWLMTHRIDRFWIPALPILALTAGVGSGWSNRREWRVAWAGVLLVGLGSNFLYATSGPGGYNAYFVPLADLRTDPARLNPDHLYLNKVVPAGGVLLSVGDAQVFDLDMPVIYNTAFDDSWFEAAAKDRTPEEFAAELAARGITHVYVHWGEIARYRSQGNYGYSEFVQPNVFAGLVAAGVLQRVRSGRDESGRLISEVYEVVGSGRATVTGSPRVFSYSHAGRQRGAQVHAAGQASSPTRARRHDKLAAAPDERATGSATDLANHGSSDRMVDDSSCSLTAREARIRDPSATRR